MASPQRHDPFAQVGEDLDLSGITAIPREKPQKNKAETKAVAEQLGFTSREPAAPAAAEPARRGRLPKPKSTKEQFNVRAERDDIERLCAIAADKKWSLGTTFGMAVAALAEKLEH